MAIRLSDLESNVVSDILPKLRSYFDQINYGNRNGYLMQIWYGDKSIFESFETYELEPSLEESAFEEKKLRLFLDGVYLYRINSIESIELICDAHEEYFKFK